MTRLGLTVALGIVVCASCSLFEELVGKGKRVDTLLVFTHQVHVVGEEMDCEECHAGGKTEGKAGMPTLESCIDCHDEPKKGSKEEKAILELKARERFKKPLWGAEIPSDLKYDHGAHGDVTYVLPSGQKKPLECQDCHGDVGGSERTPDSTTPPMELCTDCHALGKPAGKEEDKGIPGVELNACNVCHETFEKDTAPEDHKGLWKRAHGEAMKFGLDEEESKRCGYCHREDFCTDCHMREEPQSHTHFFRLRGHGIDATLNRDRCSTCHLEDACVRCHLSTRPQTHVAASWATGLQRHCTGCHIPVDSTRCVVCHKKADHLNAPLFPRDGAHTGNCTMVCHTRKHVDPGLACTDCHK
jgi:hypothetical protein